MIDFNLVLTNKEYVKEQLARKCYDVSVVDSLYAVLVERKEVKKALDETNAQSNAIAKQFGKFKNQPEEIARLKEEGARLKAEATQLEAKYKEVDSQCDKYLYDIPNFPDLDAPEGKSEADNVVIEEAKEFYPRAMEKPLPHWEIGKKLGILDIEMATKISGSMFAAYKGKGAKLLRALVAYALELHEEKYLEIIPPHMVSSKSLTYTGHLPKFANDQYRCAEDDLWLIPTAEVPLTASFAGNCYDAAELPFRCMGYTAAFRREAGSAGKDTRGLQRIHEFHKVELLKLVTPENVKTELQDLLNDCLSIIKALKLQYRIVDLCTGDMGDKYARCYDIEVYSPAIDKWLEVSSVGHFSDYQARRAEIKYKDADGKRKIPFTMNGSGMATPRIIAAILETYQQPDGTIVVPEVLRPFMGCDIIK